MCKWGKKWFQRLTALPLCLISSFQNDHQKKNLLIPFSWYHHSITNTFDSSLDNRKQPKKCFKHYTKPPPWRFEHSTWILNEVQLFLKVCCSKLCISSDCLVSACGVSACHWPTSIFFHSSWGSIETAARVLTAWLDNDEGPNIVQWFQAHCAHCQSWKTSIWKHSDLLYVITLI